MSRKLAFDKILFSVPVALALFGVVMIYSASAVLSMEKFDSPYRYLGKQATALILGFALMLWLMHCDYRRLRSRWWISTSLCVVTGLLVTVLIVSSGPARRWLDLGPFSFQPSELAKPILILFLAAFLDERYQRVNDLRRTLLPCLGIVGGIAFLIYLQPDMGTAASLCASTGILLYLAGLKIRYLVAGGAVAAVLLVAMIFQADYRLERLLTYLDPARDPLGAGYQTRQSLISFGSGGIQGVNLGEGRQKLFFLPEPHTDFIFSVVGEELGLLGTSLVLMAFLLILWRGIRASVRAPDRFGYLLGTGLTLCLVLQAATNMGMTLGLLPTKGLPLPFVSYGGSSVLIGLASVGVLLNISQHSN